MARKKYYWIQGIELKRGALKRQLGIPADKKIPKKLLIKIVKTEPGRRIRNPSQVGKRLIRVTRKLKKRSVLALTSRGFKR